MLVLVYTAACKPPEPDEFNTKLAKIHLGEALFAEPLLSSNGTSCATCHKPTLAFADTGKSSITYIDSIFGNRNTPSLLYAGLKQFYFPEGGGKNLESVSVAPLLNIHEMNTDFTLTQKALRAKGYGQFFKKAFNKDTITNQNIARALAAYIKTLNPFNAPFDRNKAELMQSEDYKIFINKCGNCHSGNLFSNEKFYTTHLTKKTIPGRYLLSSQIADSNLVQVKQLRNMLLTPPYMFNGDLNTMEDVFVFYSSVGRAKAKDEPRNKIPLSTQEKQAILRFLSNLNDLPETK